MFFEDPQSVTSQSRIKYAFIITGKRVYDCHQGIDRHAADKERRNTSYVVSRDFRCKQALKVRALVSPTCTDFESLFQVSVYIAGFQCHAIQNRSK